MDGGNIMKKEWTIDEEIEAFILSDREMAFVTTKYRATRIGFAVMLKYFQMEHQFPVEKNDIPPDMPLFIAKQLQLSPDAFTTFQFDSKTAYRQRQEILQFCGFREENEGDRKSLQDWLDDNIYEYNQDVDLLKEQIYRKYRIEKISIPSEWQIETLVRGRIRQKEQQFYQTTYQRLSATSLEKMDALLAYWGDLEDEENDKEDTTKITFRRLTLGPGRLSQATLVMELNKLQTLLDLELPDHLFTDIPAKILQKYRLRATSEDKTEVSRHNETVRYTLLSAFFWLKIRELHDSLVELLITLIHKIDGRAEKKVKMELILEVKKVFGKNKILVHLLESALQNPNGIIKDTLFSVASPEIVGDIVKELKYKNSIYQEKVHWRIRNSYSSSYRSAVTNILQTLQFKSNNHLHQPVIQAIDLLRQYHTSKQITFSSSEDIPLGPEIIPKKWYDLVIKEDSNGELKINRINYEICVLHALKIS